MIIDSLAPTPTSLFNGYLGTSLAFAYDQIGLFDILKLDKGTAFQEINKHTGCIQERLGALLDAGIALGFIERDLEGLFSWTRIGYELGKHVGYFTWSVGGYGRLFRELGTLALTEEPWSHLRDGSMVALGSDQVNISFMRDILYQVMDQIQFSKIADLGCGNAGRLIEFCKRYPDVTGVGIDINSDAIALARENTRTNGLEQAIELVCENVLEAVKNPIVIEKLRDVEVVTCFMMFHDLLNDKALRNVLFERLKKAFPSVKYFVIADTVLMPTPSNEPPIFSVGFELMHRFMGVKIHEKAHYDAAFTASGLTIEKCVDFGTPNTYLYLLRV